MLRRAGQARSQEEHQHSVRRGHGQNRPAGQAAPPVRRSAVHDVLRTSGRPMDDATRADMEARLGADFSDVRIHTDSAARASAAEIGARAYTFGSHVVIGEGGGDKHTLAHELTHVIQQRSGPVSGTDHGDGITVSDPSDRFEREADANAARAMSGPVPRPPVQRDTAPVAAAPVVQRVSEAVQTQFDRAAYPLAFLTVPAKEFDENGQPVPQPATARVGRPNAEEIEITRIPKDWAPPAPRGRYAQPHTSIKARFRSSFFTYEVELVNDPRGAFHGNPSLIDLDSPFQITSRVFRGSQGRSAGRTYAYGDRWGHNLGFWSADTYSHAVAEKLAEDHGLDPDAELAATDDDFLNYQALPYTDGQPFIFYRASLEDPRFRTDSRQFLSAQDFDGRQAARKTAVAVSTPPQTDRRDAGRGTAKAMGNTQAHQWMGPGMGGARGMLAAYEWCHLIGDKDGGPDVAENLVIGSNAVNTEQMAMETALRRHVPRLQPHGLGIQLRVQAEMEEAPEQRNPTNRLPRIREPLKARWISYQISIVPLDNPETDNPIVDVHRQIMDADRGTITEAEFTYLHHEVHNKLTKAIEALGPDMA
ncbi:DUF4157 domain-containing protein [Streptomyces sp. NPDC052020]|uniref:eCIS core domain-containing protein n=1 Tax=Streptomyces sp. NPDC052020 TaxID=3155677 RepID=UPI0034283908